MHKKILIVGLLASLAVAGIVTYGCGKAVDSGGGGSTTVGSITGTVKTVAGTSLEGVAVTVLSNSVNSNGQGWFALGNLAAASTTTIRLSKTGYVSHQSTVTVVGGQTRYYEFILAAQNTANTFSSASSGTTTGTTPTGALTSTVTVPANALVTSAGATYSGTVTFALTPGNPASTNDVVALFPGEFTAVDSTGAAVNIQSFGFANLSVTDGSNNLQLASGQSATWSQQIPAEMTAEAPATIAMWYFDATGETWRQGLDASGNPLVGTKTYIAPNWYYVGSITHFSDWNYDLAFNVAYFSGKVVDESGTAISNAQVKFWTNGWSRIGWTDTNGDFTIAVQPSKTVYAQAIKGSQKSVSYSFSSGAAGTTTAVGSLVINGGSTANIQFVLTWGANPTDLDSHLTVPSVEGQASRGHVYYNAKGSAAAFPFAWLDTDDVTSYGPEITTVTRKKTGTYRFCIHNYSGQSSYKMENSSATVEAIVGGSYYRWNIPTSNPNNYNVWQVCDLVVDSAGGVTVTPLNTYADTSATTDPYKLTGSSVKAAALMQEIEKHKK